MHSPHPLYRLALIVLLGAILAACVGASSQPPGPPTPTPIPTPTPVAVSVTSPEEAAAVVVASDPRFTGSIRLSPDLIGASNWWEARAIEGGSYEVTLTQGWGDCPSGCISRHTWTFRVAADGTLTLLGEAGDEIPDGELPG